MGGLKSHSSLTDLAQTWPGRLLEAGVILKQQVDLFLSSLQSCLYTEQQQQHDKTVSRPFYLVKRAAWRHYSVFTEFSDIK